MTEYRIEWYVPYEGNSDTTVPTLEEVVHWLRTNASRYEGRLDYVEVSRAGVEIDVFDLMKRAKEGRPLTDCQVDDAVITEMQSIIHALQNRPLDADVIERLDRIRNTVAELMNDVSPTATPGMV